MATRQYPARTTTGDSPDSSLSQQRARILQDTIRLMEDDGFRALVASNEAASRLASIVGASMELLRTAEDEIARSDERHRVAAEALTRETIAARALFEASPAALLVTDANGGIQQANAAVLALLRRNEYDVAGAPITSFLSAEDRGAFRTSLARMLDVGEVSDWEFVIRPRGADPLRVTAAARVWSSSPDAPRLLYWSLRPICAA